MKKLCEFQSPDDTQARNKTDGKIPEKNQPKTTERAKNHESKVHKPKFFFHTKQNMFQANNFMKQNVNMNYCYLLAHFRLCSCDSFFFTKD